MDESFIEQPLELEDCSDTANGDGFAVILLKDYGIFFLSASWFFAPNCENELAFFSFLFCLILVL